MLPRNNEYMQPARVIRRTKDKDGKSVGTYNQNPIQDMRVFDVEFPDDLISQYTANIIIQNIFSQVDDDSY